MAETATPIEVAKPVVTVQEGAAFAAGEVKTKLPAGEAEKAKATAAELRISREKGVRGLDTMRENAERRKSQEFTAGQRDALTGTFGAGTETPDSATEEGISRETASKQITIIGEYLDYSSILIEAQNTGKKVEDIATERGVDYKTLREHSLDTLSQLSVTRDLLGDLSSLSPAARRNVVEAYFGKQSAYRNEVAKRMQQVWEKAQTLPEEPKDQEYEDAKTIYEDATKTKADRITGMITELEGDSLVLPDDLETTLQGLITGDKSTDAILIKLRGDLLTKNNVLPANILTFDGYRQLRDREAKLQATIDSAPTDAAVTEAQARLPEVQQRIAELDERVGDGGDLHDQYVAYMRILQATAPQNQGIYSSFGEKLNDAVKAQRQIKESDKTIQKKEAAAKAKTKAWRANRLAKEAGLNNELESVFDDAAISYLEQVTAEAQKVSDQQAEQKAKEATERGDAQLAECIKALKRQQERNGVSYDPIRRRMQINYNGISESVRSAAYGGDEGVQGLMMKTLLTEASRNPNFHLPALTVSIKGPDGLPQKNPDGTYQTRAFRIDVDDLSSLSPESAAFFGKVVESYKSTFTDKLFADYSIARGMGGLRGVEGQHNPYLNSRHLRLQDHELALIEENFGSVFEAKASKSQEMQDAVAEAKAKGAKGKGLLMFIIGLIATMGGSLKGKVSTS